MRESNEPVHLLPISGQHVQPLELGALVVLEEDHEVVAVERVQGLRETMQFDEKARAR